MAPPPTLLGSLKQPLPLVQRPNKEESLYTILLTDSYTIVDTTAQRQMGFLQQPGINGPALTHGTREEPLCLLYFLHHKRNQQAFL